MQPGHLYCTKFIQAPMPAHPPVTAGFALSLSGANGKLGHNIKTGGAISHENHFQTESAAGNSLPALH